MYGVIGLLNRLTPTSHAPRISVYCYHSISDDGWRFSTTESDFKKHIEMLLAKQTPITLRDLPLYMRGEQKLVKDAFVITFDDGYADVLAVKDFLKEKNIRPTIFALSPFKTPNYIELDAVRPLISVAQMKELQASGWEIGSHSKTHADFAHLSPLDRDDEIRGAKVELEEALGCPLTSFAYPKGVYDAEIVEATKDAGYTFATTIDEGYVTPLTNPLLIPRVGVDGTHTLAQFPHLASPLAMLLRRVIKKLL
jgi:peptidoglycan/xylan/chitin deacetylase (PgdA/CDA1 family)